MWEDSRDGGSQIYGLALPVLRELSDKSVRAGKKLRIRVRGKAPRGEELKLSAGLASGESLDPLGAEFRSKGRSRGELRWTPSVAGRYVFTFRGLGEGGLSTQESVRIEVLEKKPKKPRKPKKPNKPREVRE